MKLAYRETGSGTPLIILHGLFGQSDNWNSLAKKFGEQNFRVFTVDQRNHGLSPHSNEWTYEAMAKDLRQFIEDHQLVSPVLLGHSMGGKTVMFHELLFPGAASKVVLADMAAREYPAHHKDVLDALHAVNFDQINNRKEAEAEMTKFISDFGTRQFLLKNIYWKDDESKKMDWRFNLQVISEKYDNIRVPVPFFESHTAALIVRGSKSSYVNEADIADYRKRFANCEVETIEGAGHWVHAEKPQEFFESVLKFISA